MLQNKTKKNHIANLVLLIEILLQLIGAGFLFFHTYAEGDPVFTFTLANSPYSYNYVDSKIDRFPGENGWFDSGILREQYMVESYDRFNYSGVYWHQRLDNHPLLYYSLVHSICSFFPGTYSILYALIINFISLILIDFLLIRISDFLFEERCCACAVIASSTSIVSLQEMIRYARMYMLLALVCLWFLWICFKILDQKKGSGSTSSGKGNKENRRVYAELGICFLIGSQTHYYFFVFAGILALLCLVLLIWEKSFGKIIWSFLSIAMGGCVSLILFPWVIWHILFNQMDKNVTLHLWSLEEFKEWILFVNESVCNGRGILILIILAVALFLYWAWRRRGNHDLAYVGETKENKKPCQEERKGKYWALIVLSAVLYSMVIFTLNGDSLHYATPVYLPAALCMAGIAILLTKELSHRRWRKNAEGLVSLLIVVVLLGSVSNLFSYYREVSDEYAEYEEMNAVSQNYADADCIYVASNDDNLFQNLWFELASYDEVKKIYVEEYEERIVDGAWDNVLKGRQTEGDVIWYLPSDEEIPEGSEVLSEWNGFKAVKFDA